MLNALQGRTFAPKDVTIASLQPKDNVHGIGYTPLSAKVVALSSVSCNMTPPQEFNMGAAAERRSAGFGVGVLEEDDGDDEDLYGNDDMRRYDRFLGETMPALDRFAHADQRPRQALTMQPHQDPVLPGFVKAKATSSTINV